MGACDYSSGAHKQGPTPRVQFHQWRRLHGARGARAPTFTNSWAREGGTVSRTANKKLTELYWPSWKRSPKRLIVLLEPKSGGARPTIFSGALRRIGAPTFAPDRCPHFQIRSGATEFYHLQFSILTTENVCIYALSSRQTDRDAKHHLVCCGYQRVIIITELKAYDKTV